VFRHGLILPLKSVNDNDGTDECNAMFHTDISLVRPIDVAPFTLLIKSDPDAFLHMPIQLQFRFVVYPDATTPFVQVRKVRFLTSDHFIRSF
jgi:hypothetical protein